MYPEVGRRSSGARPSTESRFQQEAFVSPSRCWLTLLPFRIEFRWFATLFAQHWLKFKVWHVFPCPTRRPPCRGNPLTLAATFLRRRYCLCSIPPFGSNLIFVSSD